MSERTVERWRLWWQSLFPTTELWREHGARFSPALSAADLPGALLGRFGGEDSRSRLIAALRFLSPLTTSWREPVRKT